MKLMITGPHLQQSAVCEPILRALPDWFGIEAALVEYVTTLADLPTFLASVDERVVGFLTLKMLNEFVAEIYVMGVLSDFHRSGIGRALCQCAEDYAREQGAEFFHVKTLGPSHPDPGYARTRKFYEGMGFRPLEETDLWGEQNPCLLMIKSLA